MMIGAYLVVLLFGSTCCQDWNLVWSDEFDGDSIDLDKWQHEITAWGGGVRKTS